MPALPDPAACAQRVEPVECRSRRLVINADDFGLTQGVCEGILQAFSNGVVTSTSALVAAPAFEQYAGELRESGLPTGIHLSAVGEDPPLCAPHEVPSLVGTRGELPSDWKRFLARATTGRIRRNDLEREFNGQIEFLVHHGINPTHVDTHQHLHLWPGITGLVLDLAKKHHIPVVRVIRPRSIRPVPLVVHLLAVLVSRSARERGLTTPDGAGGLEDAGGMHSDTLLRELRRLARTRGVADLTVHPGAAVDPDRARYPWGYSWSDELRSLCDPGTAETIRMLGFKLISYADLTLGEHAGSQRAHRP